MFSRKKKKTTVENARRLKVAVPLWTLLTPGNTDFMRHLYV